MKAHKSELIKEIEKIVKSEGKYTFAMILKKANEMGYDDPREVKEIAEYTFVELARGLVLNFPTSQKTKYDMLVAAYKRQAGLNLRTSTSILLQQYSTPIPFGYLMGLYCGVNKPKPEDRFFEPSAGNGALTVAGEARLFTVNEIDDLRADNLKYKGKYAAVYSVDGSKNFAITTPLQNYSFDAVISNPPFAKLNPEDYEEFGGYTLKDLDHVMACQALNMMKDNGKAAIIVGGHTQWDDKGRIQKGKNLSFLSYLYKHYNVEDIVLVNGDLYSKMGTSFDVRIILINGRSYDPNRYAPNKIATNANVVQTFDELYQRFLPFISHSEASNAQAQRIRLLSLKYKFSTKS